LAKCCGTFAEGESVLVNFTVIDALGAETDCTEVRADAPTSGPNLESTAIAGCVVDRGNGLRIAFEDRDWDTLWEFALEQPIESAPPSIPPAPTAETVSVKGTHVLFVDSDREMQV